jgi:hypothetical protein
MPVMNLDNGLWLSQFLVEAALVGLLTYKRVWRFFPIFFVYCLWKAASEVAAFIILTKFHGIFSPIYSSFYLTGTIVDSALEFGILVELAWAVLRPIRGSLPRFTPLVLTLLILLAGAAIWPFVGLRTLAGLTTLKSGIIHVQQTTAILRIVFFVALAGGSQFLSIGWRDRELQIATGLGFYSFVSMCVAMVHTHQASYGQYRYWQQFVTVSYICSFLYLIFSFAKKEVARREFTPQMQNVLLAMAGVAREQRAALTGLAAAGPSKSRKF